MNSDDVTERKSLFSKGSLWGASAGALLGVAFAVNITSLALAPLLFFAIVGGSSTLGMMFGNAVSAILTGAEKNPVKFQKISHQRHVSGEDLERSPELIDHLQLREQQVKKRIDSQCKDLQQGVGPVPSFTPVLPVSSEISGTHFRDILTHKPDPRGVTPLR